jgi:hypothetical protein
MKKLAILGLVMLGFFAIQASAEDKDINISRPDPDYYMGSGGEFTIDPYETSAYSHLGDGYAPEATLGDGFQTFCLETNEFVTIPGNYYVDLSNEARAGGAGGGTPDPISVGTAWLYRQFATGSLSGYDYDPDGDREESAGLLQNAIWCLENEIGDIAYGVNPFLDAAIDEFGSLTLARADYSGAAVMAMNLYGDADLTDLKQDQLVYVPDGGLTILLLGIGVGSLAFFSRKFNQ